MSMYLHASVMLLVVKKRLSKTDSDIDTMAGGEPQTLRVALPVGRQTNDATASAAKPDVGTSPEWMLSDDEWPDPSSSLLGNFR